MKLKTLLIITLLMVSTFVPQSNAAPQNAVPQENIYLLGAGDRLRIVLFGEEEISGEYEIDGSGALSLPLIGEVSSMGLSVRELEQRLTENYTGDYFKQPQINVEIINFRPFFILGEVNAPGKYAYINNMTVLQAISVAGGYTYRAKKNKMKLTRIVDGKKQEISVNEEKYISPGDVLHVNERFF